MQALYGNGSCLEVSWCSMQAWWGNGSRFDIMFLIYLCVVVCFFGSDRLSLSPTLPCWWGRMMKNHHVNWHSATLCFLLSPTLGVVRAAVTDSKIPTLGHAVRNAVTDSKICNCHKYPVSCAPLWLSLIARYPGSAMPCALLSLTARRAAAANKSYSTRVLGRHRAVCDMEIEKRHRAPLRFIHCVQPCFHCGLRRPLGECTTGN